MYYMYLSEKRRKEIESIYKLKHICKETDFPLKAPNADTCVPFFGRWGVAIQYVDIQARRQKFSEGGSFDTAGGLGATQGSQKPLGIWCKILKSSNFQTLHSNFRKALYSITNF